MRRSVAFLLTVLWLAMPALACVPTAAMANAEMACCQKMGDDCDMGAGNHACCKDTMRRAPSVAIVAQSLQIDASVVATATVEIAYTDVLNAYDGLNSLFRAGLPTLPTELSSILRI